MNTTSDLSSLKKQSRFAAALYFVNGLPAPFALIYVPSALMVRGDAAATANNVRNSAGLLRLGMAGELFSATVVIFAVLAFYSLFRVVNEKQARAMLVLLLISVPISYLNVLNDLAVLILADGPAFFAGVFDQRQLDALVLFFLRLHNGGFVLAQIFWGLWLFPFGVLIRRSGFIPPIIGTSVIIAGCGYMIASCTYLFLPAYLGFIGKYATILQAGELPLLWMVIWGAREQTHSPAPPAPALA